MVAKTEKISHFVNSFKKTIDNASSQLQQQQNESHHISISLPNSQLKNKTNFIKNLNELTRELLGSFHIDSPNEEFPGTSKQSQDSSKPSQSQMRKRNLSQDENVNVLDECSRTKQLKMDQQLNYEIKLEIKITSNPNSQAISSKHFDECLEDVDGEELAPVHVDFQFPVDTRPPPTVDMSICMTNPNTVFTTDDVVIDTPIKENLFELEDEFIKRAIMRSGSRLECLNSTHNNNTTIKEADSTLKLRQDDYSNCTFVCSLLKPEIKDKVRQFLIDLGAQLGDDISDGTTHLIVQSDDDLVCGVTTKYLKAITKKLWIISVQWVLKCIEEKKQLDLSQFEIKGDSVFGLHCGPRRSRLSKKCLFDGYQFLFVGKFTSTFISLNDLAKLAQAVGASIVEKAKNFQDDKIRVTIFDEKLKSITEEAANFMLESAKIYSVNASWFFDSLACYEVKNMSHYALYTIKN